MPREPSDYEWKTTDPRLSINKRANIVVLRPSIQGRGILEASTAFVDTKETWYVHTAFAEHSDVSEDDNWPEGWLWTWAPDRPV